MEGGRDGMVAISTLDSFHGGLIMGLMTFITGNCKQCIITRCPVRGRAIRFSKILSDFCSRCLNHLILHLKRPGRNIRSKN